MRGAIVVCCWLGMLILPGVAFSATPEAGDVHLETALEGSEAEGLPLGTLPHDPTLQKLSAAWAIPAAGLDERVERLQEAGAALGLANLEGPAQALLFDDIGSELERAKAARALAPDLPAAHAALARAAWGAGEPGTAWRALLGATGAVGRHVESRSWLGLFAWHAVQWAALLAGVGFVLLALAVALPSVTRRLGAVAPGLPAAARLATLGALLLLPAALGEGLLGIVLAAMALAAVKGGGLQRLALLAGGFLTLGAVFPLLDEAARARVDLAHQATAAASQQVERGVASPVERARVADLSGVDALAGRARALAERRAGAHSTADARFAHWMGGAGPEALANAATARLALGERKEAVALLERAAEGDDDPIILFNLSQAYGGVVAIERQNQALVRAQALDAGRTHELVASFGPGQLVDRPLRPQPFRPVEDSETGAVDGVSSSAVSGALRRRLAPGQLGQSSGLAVVSLLAALVLGMLAGRLLERAGQGEADLRTRIAQLIENRLGDANERLRHLAELRRRQAFQARAERLFELLVPGAAGLLGGRPILAWAGFLWAAFFASLAFVGGFVPIQPLALGCLPELVLPFLLAVGLIGHVALIHFSIRLLERA